MIGRTAERKDLEKIYVSKSCELGVVYGRRRVGKSYLLGYLIKKPGQDLYFEAIRKLGHQEQIDHFCKQLAEQTKSFQAKAQTWHEAFDVLTLTIQKGDHFIVFDELPWMADEKPELVAIQRRGRIITIIECKFKNEPIGLEVIKEMNKKMSKLKIPKNYTVEKVLITASDVTVDVEESEYFNKVLGLDIFY